MRIVVFTALLVTSLLTVPTRPIAAQEATATPSAVRVCAQPTRPHAMACMAVRRGGIEPDTTPIGYGPADLQSAYQIPSGAAGVTIAIIDAYDDPRAESDLATYRAHYDLAACTTANGCFRKVNQNGRTSPRPAANSDWSGEISLDLDMVSATCPLCHILLIEASSNDDTDLFSAINRAVSMGAKYVSNSWGGDEESSETSLDQTYLKHPGVVITASTGDDGYGTEFPAASRYVTAVGGTSLTRTTGGRGWSETVWSGAGSGCSTYETRPTWQTATPKCTRRGEADVSAVADPNTGVAVYQTYGGSGWSLYGGTSAAAPIIASMYALAGTPGATDYPASYPYAHPTDLFDVVSGRNGSCGSVLCAAATGWDGPTGLGTPHGTAAFRASGCGAIVTVADPGFETGTSPWAGSTGIITSATTADPAHTGTHLARFDGTGTAHTDALSQTVNIPGGCSTVTLTYWLRATSTGTTADGTFRLAVGGTTLHTSSNLDQSGYEQVSVDLTRYMGQSVTFTFTGTENSSQATTFSLDDVASAVS